MATAGRDGRETLSPPPLPPPALSIFPFHPIQSSPPPSTHAQANINRLADEAEAELAARRAVIEADRAELEAFEADTAAARSEGLFFGGLHKNKGGEAATTSDKQARPPPSSSSNSSSITVDASSRMRAALSRLPGDVADASGSRVSAGAAGGAASTPSPSSSSSSPRHPPDPASAIVTAASSEVRSSLRYGVWLVLCIATGGVAIIDLFGVEPAFGADAAALGLAGLLGWSAAREGRAVEEAARVVEARARRRGEE